MLRSEIALLCDSCRAELPRLPGTASGARTIARYQHGWGRVHDGAIMRDLCATCLDDYETAAAQQQLAHQRAARQIGARV